MAPLGLALRVAEVSGIRQQQVERESAHSTSQREFARTVANVLQRPAWITTPAWSLRLLAGEMADLFLSGQNVVPQKLLQKKFVFRYPDLESALKNLL